MQPLFYWFVNKLKKVNKLIGNNMCNKTFLATILMSALYSSFGFAFCSDSVEATVNADKFVFDEEQGIVTDTSTGLMWSMCNLGESWNESLKTCSGSASDAQWQNSLQQASQTEIAGFSDWRLPNLKELMSIIERQCAAPAANLDLFPTMKAEDYWTSTPVFNQNSANYVWAVQFDEGSNFENKKSSTALTRLVRKVNDFTPD